MTAKTKPVSKSNVPNETWTEDQLTGEVMKHWTEFQAVARKSVMELWQTGRGLFLLRELLGPKKKFSAWRKKHEFAESTVNQAIKLYEEIQENEIGDFTNITRAKIAAGIVRERTSKVDAEEHGRGTPTSSNEVLGLDADNWKMLQDEYKRLFGPVKAAAAALVKAVDTLTDQLDEVELEQEAVSLLDQTIDVVQDRTEALRGKLPQAA